MVVNTFAAHKTSVRDPNCERVYCIFWVYGGSWGCNRVRTVLFQLLDMDW